MAFASGVVVNTGVLQDVEAKVGVLAVRVGLPDGVDVKLVHADKIRARHKPKIRSVFILNIPITSITSLMEYWFLTRHT